MTKDRKIRTRPGERDAYLAAGVRLFCATREGNYSMWELARLLVAQWDRMEEIADNVPGPYIYSITKAGVRFLVN